MSRPQAQRGQSRQALGRSWGGFSTKIYLKTDWAGDPLGFCLTGGEAGDSPHFEMLLDLGPDITPQATVGDKGYDAKANQQAARSRGLCSAIPYRTTTKDKPKFFPKALYCRFRFHSARDSEMKPAAIPINPRPPFRDKSGHHSDHCPARG